MLDVITAKLLRKSGVNVDDSVQKNLCSFHSKTECDQTRLKTLDKMEQNLIL